MAKPLPARSGRWLLLASAGLTLLAVRALYRPWKLGGLAPEPAPAQDYAAAEARIATLRATASPGLNPACALQFLTHGQAVERVAVLVHGYSNCPRQYRALAERFFALGYNVLAAPLPHHGLADRMTEDQARLSAEELRVYADEVVDIAQGLGGHVTMLGISGGGITTAWAAQNRADLDLAVIIAPAFGFVDLAPALTVPAANVIPYLPNQYAWWDPVGQAASGPAHTYPRYATHTLANILRLGFAVEAAARRDPPAAGRLIVVTNANDVSVDNAAAARVAARWQRLAPGRVTTYEFPRELGLDHDLLDPDQPNQQVDLVNDKLLELITLVDD
jgi:carboxylesterase